MTQTTERPGRPAIIDRSQRSEGKTNALNNIDCVPSNVRFFHQEALLYVFEDNEAVIKMNFYEKESHNETCFQDSQSCSWLVVRSNQFGPKKNQIKYIDTKKQLADILTKRNVTRDEWNHLLCLFNISHCSSTVRSEIMAKRSQHDS